MVVITGHCAVCAAFLTKKFPDDFPDEWKFCCYCKNMAKYLTNRVDPKYYINLSYQMKKILKKVTLVGK